MSQHTTQHAPRTFEVIAPGRRTPFVRCGEKDYFHPANPADMAELAIVLSYSQR
ncbi:hypothetical protein [Actinoplanes regularis]|uniref:Uncharacterized protein n=1 Tax=Actinoplanes regularis TaxID=52697 RepID=A0A238XIU8_9ACTN|nr:hypothetical protein [Actinoplanes regularis]GIE90481.1 hypothetical protein Are01nite_69610 [Actinoplanes regularis]SNR58501.1 hypothetical protein SAMN06264365_103473 [Actinoplanes regularis]